MRRRAFCLWARSSEPERFAQTIARLSEPTQGPAADNFVSNEDSYPRVAALLGARKRNEGVYLGVGPDQNFTFIAHAEPSVSFLADFRRRNLLLHLLHKALFTLAPDRMSYLSALTARAPASLAVDAPASALVAHFQKRELDPVRLRKSHRAARGVLEPLQVLNDAEWAELATLQARVAGPGLEARFLALRMYPTLARMINTPGHFLQSHALYQRVRERQINHQVIPIVGDFAGTTTFPRLGAWLRERSRKVDVVYMSDVEFFLVRSGRLRNYVANLEQLPWTDDALLIRTSTREIAHPARVAGDSSTTIGTPVHAFLEQARKGKINTIDDLFRDAP